ncbi:hypothetical protein BDF22DRAFT_773832 [Syncephalis plumigaleata]|nr:hypothetical protein BDF22DRAFT_773832 [Syncephalis plumigaleata]
MYGGEYRMEIVNINMKFSAVITIAVAIVAVTSLVVVEAAPALDRRAPAEASGKHESDRDSFEAGDRVPSKGGERSSKGIPHGRS